MDDRARLALEELVRALVSRDLDELHVRVSALEERSSLTRGDYLESRRRTAAELHRRGVTLAEIARRLGVAPSTAARDLEPPAHPPNGRVRSDA
jgi:hypothetical protein